LYIFIQFIFEQHKEQHTRLYIQTEKDLMYIRYFVFIPW